MAEVVVVWEEADKHLPISHEPEVRQARKDLFKKLCPKGKKTLTLDDVQKGMKAELRYDMAGTFVPGVKEMTKTIKFAFKTAADLAPAGASPKAKAKAKANTAVVDTGVAHAKSKAKNADTKGKSVDKREFHAFLQSLRYMLELDELFEQLDGGYDDDQKLSLRECMKGAEKLNSWGISEDDLKEHFVGVDAWIAHMKFDDFADWVMGVRMASVNLKLDDSDDEEVLYHAGHGAMVDALDPTFRDLGSESELNKCKAMEAFKKWDADGGGGISLQEMSVVMKELNPKFDEATVKRLFDAADTSKDGIIDFNEFLLFIFK